jgi:hypothetical protein
MEKNQFVDIAKLEEIPPGKMKHAETDGNEILVANVEGNSMRYVTEVATTMFHFRWVISKITS